MANAGAGMLKLIHWIIVGIYLVLPAAALGYAIWRRIKGRRGVLGSLVLTFIAGSALSLAISLVYANLTNGRIVTTQVLIGAYFAVGMLLLLKGFDASVRLGLRKAMGLLGDDDPAVRKLIGSLVRVVIVAGLGLPYVMSSVMTYRPKVHPTDDPKSQLGFDYQRVTFRATDGVELVGWWIPAEGSAPDAGTRTVLVCHGLAANKSNQLVLGRLLVPAGFNVLAFDFRAHGESGGQLTTFGAHEVRDVLGAVRWVRERHPEQSRKIYGLGASMGGSALIAAAADDSDEGRAIDAVATYAAYDSLDGLADSITHEYFPGPLGWLLRRIGIPLASAQTGANLKSFSPADHSSQMWPRPLLLIHGARDQIIPFSHARILLNSATAPKYHLWLDEADHNDVLGSDGAARVVLRFFQTSRPEPVI